MIKQVSLSHGWFYHYRIHSEKAKTLCNEEYSKLNSFLLNNLNNCPDEYFKNGPRGSTLRFSIPIKKKEHSNHEISRLCSQGLKTMNNYKTTHSKVQVFMLQFDKNTISVETPIWLLSDELNGFESIFNETKPLSGHIDILRVEDDKKIWVWDYKPKAEFERFAATQVYFYSLMMHLRTGIPLDNFMCGYFDENVAYTFKPEENVLLELRSQRLKEKTL
ncbi:MAG: hypothetical protein KKA51_02080 [Nanoarchaeota archaeon]|nr:hypothetical protein [Nanoarchaeota archaeon]